MAQPERVASIDIVRGLVMVLMAIDHVRVYSGQPAGGPDAAIFFTRWVTHFCAPAFAFFAGMSAFLYGRKLGDTRGLRHFLLTRGMLLVLLELTVIRLAWTFQFNFLPLFAGVIWMLGWCMILLAGLVQLPAKTVGAVGLGIILLQQLFGIAPGGLPKWVGWIWEFVYPAGLQRAPNTIILYVLVPWIGVMALGYGFGAIVVRGAEERRQLFLKIGLIVTGVFLVAGMIAINMSPAPPDSPMLFQLLNQRKYPASQLYLLMTLGPTILLLGLTEHARGWLARVLTTFGRVPLFYYLLHIPTIHLAALAVTFFREGTIHPERYVTAPFAQVPVQQMWSLPLLYLVFAVVVVALYFPCRWMAGVKSRRRESWLSIL